MICKDIPLAPQFLHACGFHHTFTMPVGLNKQFGARVTYLLSEQSQPVYPRTLPYIAHYIQSITILYRGK
jgi:hypothetical protein